VKVMKFRPVTLSLALLWPAYLCSVQAQGTFRNLDFESANIPVSTPAGTFVPASLALPGWAVFIGTNQQSSVMYNGTYLDTATVAVFGPGAPFYPPIQGSYSAVLKNGVDPNGAVGDLVDAAIAQTGLIPSSAKSILFSSSSGAELSVTLAGQRIVMVPLYPSGAYEVYGGDITALAGQTAELRLTDPVGPPFPFSGVLVDNIVFSDIAIPEPATVALFTCGAAAVGLLSSWRRPSRRRGAYGGRR
jgi:hypothetical protein